MHEPHLDLEPFPNIFNAPNCQPEVLYEELESPGSIEESGIDASVNVGALQCFNKPDDLRIERINSDTMTRPCGEDSIRMFSEESLSASPARSREYSFHVDDQISKEVEH